MPIIHLQRRIAEKGRIRLGRQVTTQSGKKRPSKLTRFRLTSADRAAIERAASLYGGTPAEWVDAPGDGAQWEVIIDAETIPVVVPPADLGFSQWYELWSAGGCQRRCDGQVEQLSDEPCLCDPDPAARDCKPTTRLKVILPEVAGMGMWRLESHGYYAASELAGAVEMCQRLAAMGELIPARLRLEQRESKIKAPSGKVQTAKYAVPVIDIDVALNQLGTPVALGQVEAGRASTLSGRNGSLTPVQTRALPEAPSASIADQAAGGGRTRRRTGPDIPSTGLEPTPAAGRASAAHSGPVRERMAAASDPNDQATDLDDEDSGGGGPAVSAPSPDRGPVEDITKAVIIRIRELIDEDDDTRHAIVAYCTKGRASSSRDLTDDEAHTLLRTLDAVEDGSVYWDFGEGKFIQAQRSTAPHEVEEAAASADDESHIADGFDPLGLDTAGWRSVLKERGVSQAGFLREMGDVARDLDLEAPASLAKLASGPDRLKVAAAEWLAGAGGEF